MKIIIVRHAQTDENVGGELAGVKSDIPLNSEGIMQAKKLGYHLRGHQITRAYSSPAKRAKQTVEAILAHHSVAAISYAEALREQDKSGGETRQQVQDRVKTFFHALAQKHQNSAVLMVSHGGPLGVLHLHLLGKELTEENYRAYQPKNAEFTMVEILSDGNRRIHVLNSRDHLS